MLANNVDPDQMPHYVASDLGLHCLPRYGYPVYKGLRTNQVQSLLLVHEDFKNISRNIKITTRVVSVVMHNRRDILYHGIFKYSMEYQ